MTRFARTLAALALVALPAHAQTASTFTLDSGSYVSFQDATIVQIPSGSIVFQLGEPLVDGTIPFTISPALVSIPPLVAPDGETALHYRLAAPTSGTIVPTPEGGMIQFTARVAAELTEGAESRGTIAHTVPFTTELAVAQNAAGEHVEATGIRLVDGAAYAQIVGATVNPPGATPGPGAPVYTVLSGRFDPAP